MLDEIDEEKALRTDQMRVNIEKMRADLRWEGRRFAVQLVVGMAAVAAASATVATYVARLQGPPAPQTIVVQTSPPAK